MTKSAIPSFLIVLALACQTSLQGCSPAKTDNRSTPFLPAAKEKPLPVNPLLRGSFTPLRQDTFYTTYIESGNNKESLNDRFVSNGKGFVAYSQRDGFDDGYYLYNFYGHTSFYVQIKDRTYHVAMSSPGDDLLVACQAINSAAATHPDATGVDPTRLEAREIDGIKCQGITFIGPDGAKQEVWYEPTSRRLVEQTVQRSKQKISRHLRRFNTYCDTMLLRLPEGFTLEK